MRELIASLVLSAALSPYVFGRGPYFSRSSSHSVGSHRGHSSRTYPRHSHRSAAAKRNFERETGCPHGPKSYVVDHIVPLAYGGRDEPSNMQWQPVTEAKAKDK